MLSDATVDLPWWASEPDSKSRTFGVPMDVLWFRLPRLATDPEGVVGRISRSNLLIMIDRGDYFQIGMVIRKGSLATLRDHGIEALRQRLRDALPWLGDRVDLLTSFDDIRLLNVVLSRLPRWYRDGLLCIGDAAHAMSPVGGVGINLAVQDAVAAGRLLAPSLRTGRVATRTPPCSPASPLGCRRCSRRLSSGWRIGSLWRPALPRMKQSRDRARPPARSD